MEKFNKKIETKYFILLGVLFLTTLALADTNKVSVVGFDKAATYFVSVFGFVKFLGYISASIYFIFKLLEFITSQQWDQLLKSFLIFAVIVGAIYGISSIVKILGGTTVNENVKKIKIVELEKIKFLGEDNERK
nr:hypothetical protein [Streptobacillus moniliformis]